MGEFKEKSELEKAIYETIDGVAELAEIGTEFYFNAVREEDVQKAEKDWKKCKKICRRVKVMVLAICATIIYFHLKG